MCGDIVCLQCGVLPGATQDQITKFAWFDAMADLADAYDRSGGDDAVAETTRVEEMHAVWKYVCTVALPSEL